MKFTLRKITGVVSGYGMSKLGNDGSQTYTYVKFSTPEGDIDMYNVLLTSKLTTEFSQGRAGTFFMGEMVRSDKKPEKNGSFVYAIEGDGRVAEDIGPIKRSLKSSRRNIATLYFIYAFNALLISIFLVGIPFLIFFTVKFFQALNLGIPSESEMRRFMENGQGAAT